MIQEKSGKHIIDGVFVICLMLLFLISALTVIAIGASIYKKNVETTGENYSQRVSFAYVTEKVRQADQKGLVFVDQRFGENALILQQKVGETLYDTIIYDYEGYLCELFVRDDLGTVYPNSGQKILQVGSFDIEEITDGLLSATITDKDGCVDSVYIAVKSRNEN
ncbi:MAG: DUF4860 domain-containing protein [Butyrivibrio sp.]|nr:DUF4860 domain-containing protein [Butyrivibrio sp.]MBQ6415184.1 DUF4860 domain-containing protein [Butyrivibrio sp.]